MTNKRFTLIEVNGNIEDSCTQIVYDGGEDVFELLNLLNSLHDEIEQLKEENKKLQGEYDKQLWLYNGLGCEYDWLKKENEELKQLNIPVDEIEETVSDIQGRIITIYYKR